ncbi:MAG TPA: alginate export family protein, partial [Cellvibrionaceae bacterium]|nr:alginate export family protein [Cellvibrionaceae bacterium]
MASGWQNQHSDGVRFNGEPRIPDVPGGDINQLFLRYGSATQQLTLGRQTLEWDDLRFLSANNFWQNPQSFDAFHIDRSLAETSHIQYAYISKSLRIFGRDADTRLQLSDINYHSLKGQRPRDGLGEHQMHSHALKWQWREWDYTDLTVYGYFINNETAANFSNDTI